MQTQLADFVKHRADAQQADDILRRCVHCGFCTATCPTYQLLGDELDSPRGRIYLIKQVLEGQADYAIARHHLDRCLTCRSCETTCPSGVAYARLWDIGQTILDEHAPRPWWKTVMRQALLWSLPYPQRFGAVLTLGRIFKPILPIQLKKMIPAKVTLPSLPMQTHARSMLGFKGCVQQAATPDTFIHSAKVLDRLGIELVNADSVGCCGAVAEHMQAKPKALQVMRDNIDAWWPFIEPELGKGIEAIVISASGCSSMVKEYGHLLANDPDYADKADKVASLAKDLTEVISAEPLEQVSLDSTHPHYGLKISVHEPCTLQHGQACGQLLPDLLSHIGFDVQVSVDAHLCCGAAGTYAMLQYSLSQQLLQRKLIGLQNEASSCIVTANIGCQLQLQQQAKMPVKHWVTLLSESI